MRRLVGRGARVAGPRSCARRGQRRPLPGRRRGPPTGAVTATRPAWTGPRRHAPAAPRSTGGPTGCVPRSAHHWHPVCAASDLPGPVGVRLLGRDLVVARLGPPRRGRRRALGRGRVVALPRPLPPPLDPAVGRRGRRRLPALRLPRVGVRVRTVAASTSRRCPTGPIPGRAAVDAFEAVVEHGLVWVRLDPSVPTRGPGVPRPVRPRDEGADRRAVHLAGRRAPAGRELRRPRPLRLRARRQPGPAGRAGAADPRRAPGRGRAAVRLRPARLPRRAGRHRHARRQQLPDADAVQRRHRLHVSRRPAPPAVDGGQPGRRRHLPHVLVHRPHRRPRRRRSGPPRVPGPGAGRGRAGRRATRCRPRCCSTPPPSCRCAPTRCRSSTAAGCASWRRPPWPDPRRTRRPSASTPPAPADRSGGSTRATHRRLTAPRTRHLAVSGCLLAHQAWSGGTLSPGGDVSISPADGPSPQRWAS